jgi:hypothetical protein
MFQVQVTVQVAISRQQSPEYFWLVVSTPLKNSSQLGLLFPVYGKIKILFQTTNQFIYVDKPYSWINKP